MGTTTISLVLVDESGRVFPQYTIEHKSSIEGQHFEKLQDVHVIEKIAVNAINMALNNDNDICCIGITGQMHGIVYVDGEGNALGPLYTWQDARGEQIYEANESYAAYLSRISGYHVATGYGLVTHFYNLINGLVPADAVKICTIQDYIAMKLAGRNIPVTDVTNAASLGMFDLKKKEFDLNAIQKAGIDTEILPDVINAGIMGKMQNEILIFSPIGDNQASFFGATKGFYDKPLINIGTGSQISVYIEKYKEVLPLETRPFPSGGWLLVGASLCGGKSYALLEKFIRDSASLIGKGEGQAYDAMRNMLDNSPKPMNYPHVITTFQGTRADPTATGSIDGLSTQNFTPLHLAYGIMYGMADELYALYTCCLDAGYSLAETIIGSGNGLRKNSHLCKILEEKFKCLVLLAENEEEAAYGAALYALKHI